ncbi:rod-binding protein [Sphingomonas sp. ID0503]|uniref:rod-binding protein n=1 Tax=Sphingomonas sp. ID0503 TaxID=3399691 RepID=UPI003AFA49EC
MTTIPGTSSTTALVGSAGSTLNDTSRLKNAANLKEAGEKFEAMFIGMMMKSMRATKLGGDILGSSSLDKFRDMQDQKTAEDMAKKMPLGIGAALTKFLAQGDSTLTTPQPSSSTNEKGSTESSE